MIYKGRVKVTRPSEKGRFLAWLSAGDYFGEEAVFETAIGPPPSLPWRLCVSSFHAAGLKSCLHNTNTKTELQGDHQKPQARAPVKSTSGLAK